ncbi:hypothetical protein Tco_1026135 [Tanacetum coccineum]
MRTASAAAKPCQGDSSEFYLITGSIYTDQWGTMVITTVFDELKNFKKDATLNLFKSTNQERLIRGERGDVHCSSYLVRHDPYYCSANAPTADLPVIHDDTLLIPTDTTTISPIVPTIPSIAPTIQYTSPFVCTDSSDSDTPDTPPSQDPYEVTVAQGRIRVAARSSPPSPSTRQILPAPLRLPRRPAILVLPWQLIPLGQLYRIHSNEVLKMLTAKKRVGTLPTHDML